MVTEEISDLLDSIAADSDGTYQYFYLKSLPVGNDAIAEFNVWRQGADSPPELAHKPRSFDLATR
jgi:hypothetical protein